MAKFNFPFFGNRKTLEQRIDKILVKRNQSIQGEPSAKIVDQSTRSNSISNILKNLKSKVLSVIGGGNRGIYVTPEWDFKKIQLAFTNESIFRRSVEKYVEQILLITKNQEILKVDSIQIEEIEEKIDHLFYKE